MAFLVRASASARRRRLLGPSLSQRGSRRVTGSSSSLTLAWQWAAAVSVLLALAVPSFVSGQTTTGSSGGGTTGTTGEVRPPTLSGSGNGGALDASVIVGILVGLCCCCVICCCFATFVGKQRHERELTNEARKQLDKAREQAATDRKHLREAQTGQNQRKEVVKPGSSPDDSWFEMVDRNGQVFYYNSTTGETRYP